MEDSFDGGDQIGNRGEGKGRSAARKRVRGTSSVKTGNSSNRISHGSQVKAVPAKEEKLVPSSHQNPRIMGSAGSATASDHPYVRPSVLGQ